MKTMPTLLRAALCCLLLTLLTHSEGTAQREYGVCDYTEYLVTLDTTLAAYQKKLYLKTPSGLTLLRDFTHPDPDYFIRDVDLVHDSLWYTLVGSRYIGTPTDLYRSSDRGQTWQLDTSHYPAARQLFGRSNRDGITALQHFGKDTVVLFLGYVISGIVYSTDGGQTWQGWFRNLPEHYYGMASCRDSLYLYGLHGGLSASMFAFPRNKLFSNDSTGQWDNWRGILHADCPRDPRCVLAPGGRYGRCEIYHFFNNYVDSICQLVTARSTVTIPPQEQIYLYPNPSRGTIQVEGNLPAGTQLAVHNHLGQQLFAQEVRTDRRSISLALDLPAGVYSLVARRPRHSTVSQRIVVQSP